MNGRYEFVSPEWDEISDAAKDMVREDDTKNNYPSLCFIMTVSIFVSDKKVASCWPKETTNCISSIRSSFPSN